MSDVALPSGRVKVLLDLIDEAYADYFARSDGYCKSAEGSVEIELGTHFDRRDGGLRPQVVLHGYALSGLNGCHDGIEAAIEVATQVRDEQLATRYDEAGDPIRPCSACGKDTSGLGHCDCNFF